MVILHIAHISSNPFSGVSVVVPRHVAEQGKYAETALLNISGEKIEGVRQLTYASPFRLEDLSAPFDVPDLVVFHECYHFPYLAMARAFEKKKIPYIILPHGELSKDAQRKKHLKKAVANFLLFNRFVNNAAAIQCLSEREEKTTHFGKRHFIGTNGIAIPESEKKEFSEDGIRFVYIGRLDMYHKGLDLLIKAVEACRDYFDQNHCTLDIYGPDILGRGAELHALIEETHTKDVIRVFSPVSGEEKEKKMLGADVFIQTSRFEGMPMGVLEALSYGIPCALTEGTTLAALVREHGAGFASETTTEGVARMFEEIVRRKNELPEMPRRAKDMAMKCFSWDRVAEGTVEKYKELIAK